MSHKKFFLFLLLIISIFAHSLQAQIKIEITNAQSLARLGRNPHPRNCVDKKIALTFYNALSQKKIDSLKFIEKYYDDVASKDTTHTKIFSSLGWIIKCINADKNVLKKELVDPVSADLYYFFTKNNFQRLKEYLKIKHNLFDYRSKDSYADIKILTFYDDLLMFNDPNREAWDSTSKIMSYLPLKKGEKVIDLGCGFGYNSFRLSKVVGEKGIVYATDIDSNYIDHLNQIVQKSGVKNIFPLITSPYDIGIHDSVDAVFISSLYHMIYGWSNKEERTALYKSMKQSLKVGGYLIIADNLNLHGFELNNCFIDKRLIIAQLAYWGFSYIDYKEFAKQRYVIIFKYTREKVKEQTLYADGGSHDTSFLIKVDSGRSIFNSRVSTCKTVDKGIELKKVAYDFFKTDSTINSIDLYEMILPDKSSVEKYDFVKWVCESKRSPGKEQSVILKKDTLSNCFNNSKSKNDDPFSVKKQADIIFINLLYRKIYSVFSEPSREKLFRRIIANMSANGKLIIIDDGPTDDGISFDYGQFIFKDLVKYQLAFYGFELIKDEQISSRRYELTFKLK